MFKALTDGSGTTILEKKSLLIDDQKYAPLPAGTNDFYMQWSITPKEIGFEYDPSKPANSGLHSFKAPDGKEYTLRPRNGFNSTFTEYNESLFNEDSSDITVSLKGYETGNPNEYVIDNDLNYSEDGINKSMAIRSFTISSPGSTHTYPAGDLTTYTFTGGIDKDVTLTLHWERVWHVEYFELNNTSITGDQELKESDLPYTFRTVYPPHPDWHGFKILPLGWTKDVYRGSQGWGGFWDTEGIYTSTGSLPTLYRGTTSATDFSKITSPLKLYPLYGVDVNNDGTADLFQNKSTFTIKKEVIRGIFTDPNAEFPYEVTFNDVHGNPIKNWPVQDTAGNTYTTDTNGKVTVKVKNQSSITFMGMLPNMILKAVETDTRGMSAEYAISYNGAAYTSGADTGDITFQDNTPLTVGFKNTDNRTIVPAGVHEENTKTIALIASILLSVSLAYWLNWHRRHRGAGKDRHGAGA